jgi:sulfur dioxygenase
LFLYVGDAGLLYDGIHSKILSLPDQTLVYPAHDYKGWTVSSIAEEKSHNPRFTKDKEGFVKFMAELGLPYPKKIDVAVPANLRDGREE